MRRLLIAFLVSGIALPVFAAFSGTDVFVGAVGRGPGAASSDWYTSVWVHNPGTAAANVTAYLLLRNQTNPSPASQTLVVQPGETRRIDNVVETLFGVSAFGAMRFTSASKILVNARIYSKLLGTADSESSGQSFDGVPASFAIGAGQSTAILGAHQTSPFDASLFRYNFGYVETAGGSGTMRATASDAAGTPLGTKDYDVGPFEARQFGIADVVPGVNSTNVRLTIAIVSGSAKVIAFGSGIANRSNDPTTFDMSFRDELLAGPAAPTSVSHDGTLIGDGSAASPLGVAGAGGATAGTVLTATGSGGTAWQTVPGFTLPFQAHGLPGSVGAVFQVDSDSTANDRFALAGYSHGNASGIIGWAESGAGVNAVSGSGIGLQASSDSGIAVRGISSSNYGVLGSTSSGVGVYGRSDTGIGVQADSNHHNALTANSADKEAVRAVSIGSHGVYGESDSSTGYGVVGFNSPGNHAGLIGTLGFAGDFVGDVRVKGALSKFSGSFTIDHPLDPEHKTLSHSFVESPDMKNVYDGVVVTDNEGFAVVDLPDWFEALNRDFRYQLTVIGRFAQAIVDTEIANNRFTIRTDHPSVKVSWQVTGIRRDPWANAHRIVVEEEKPADEQGTYLAPEVYGQPRSKDAFWARHPELRK